MTPTGSAGITQGGASPGGDGLAFALGVPGGVPVGLGLALGVSVGVGRLGIGFCFGVVEDEGPVKSIFGMFLISIGFLSQKGNWSVARGGRSSRGMSGISHPVMCPAFDDPCPP